MAQLDKKLSGTVSRALDLGDFLRRRRHFSRVGRRPKIKRMLLIGCGKADDFDSGKQKKFAETVGRVLAAGKAKPQCAWRGWVGCKGTCRLGGSGRYGDCVRYVYTHAQQTQEPAQADKGIHRCGSAISANKTKAAISSGMAIGSGINFVRELGNLPANICTPVSCQAGEVERTARQTERQRPRRKKMREKWYGLAALRGPWQR